MTSFKAHHDYLPRLQKIVTMTSFKIPWTLSNTWWNMYYDLFQDKSWNTYRDFFQDTSWNIYHDLFQDTSWNIYHDLIQAWNIYHDSFKTRHEIFIMTSFKIHMTYLSWPISRCIMKHLSWLFQDTSWNIYHDSFKTSWNI